MSDIHDPRNEGKVEPPTREQLAGYTTSRQLTDGELDRYVDIVAASLDRYFGGLGDLENPPLTLRHRHRDSGRVPTDSEDPYNAIVRFCEVRGADLGPLVGKSIGVKDVIPVAGVPMTSGIRRHVPPVPSEDAVVIERLLDAGATIAAKTNISDGLHPAQFGETRNPHNPLFSPGGSSSGSAAAVASGIVDAALGTDGAGSVRIPAAWCGLVAIKPTHGLVPLHGCRDHATNVIGPITATVADNAAMLEVMAGSDWRDPQSVSPNVDVGSYTSTAGLGIEGLRVGVVNESLEASGCTAGTLKAFDRAQKILVGLGALVRPVSVPLWTETAAIFWPIFFLGTVVEANSFGQGYANHGRVDLSLMAAMAAQHESEQFHIRRMTVEHLRHTNHGLAFGMARNLALQLRRQVDGALADVDVLITPTTVTGPFKLPNEPHGTEMAQDTAPPVHPMVDTMAANTWALNVTGHPALSVPAGRGDNDLPTGLQIIGRRYDEVAVYRTGFAFEGTS